MTPSLIINQKTPTSLIISGVNLSHYTTCEFRHNQVSESPVIIINNTSISCRLPLIDKELVDPRFVAVTLKIDEDNSYAIKQNIQYIPSLKIVEYLVESEEAVVQI